MAAQAQQQTDRAAPDRVVEARGLTKYYGEFCAVDHIDFDIKRGTCFGLLGPNGAGKTTAIRMIQGVSPVDEGTLQVLGKDIRRNRRELKHRMGVVPQEDNLDPDFTVRDNLILYARFFDVPKAEARKRADELLEFLQLTDKADGNVEALSGGMKRRLIAARALVNDPELLILDEPTTGLDPQARHVLWEKIRALRRQGKTILLTTHYMDEAEMLCDELVIIDQGRIHERGAPAELVRKHTGGEAVEFACPDDPALIRRISEDLEQEDIPFEALPDRVIAFGSDMEPLQHRIRERFDVTETILRRATLEDVFLRLTGRALRE